MLADLPFLLIQRLVILPSLLKLDKRDRLIKEKSIKSAGVENR